MTKENAYLCPNCGSSLLTVPVLVGANYRCGVCKWEGNDPVTVPFDSPFASGSDAFKEFVTQFLKEFSKSAALPLGKLLVSWGFVPVDASGKPSTRELALYMNAMAKAMVAALIEERAAAEREKLQ